MDIQKEKEAYLKMLVGNDAISNDQAETLKLMSEGSHFYTYGNQVSAAKLDLINWGWNSWVKAKSQAVPEGFVAVPINDLMTVLCNCSDAMENESTSSVYDETGQPSTWFDHHVVAEKNILSFIPDAQEQSHEH